MPSRTIFAIFPEIMMSFLTNPEFWARWMGIVLIDLTLAGDNALVIALAVRNLPPRQQFWGRVGGTAGAVILRVIFIVIVTTLLQIPLLRLVGGLLLIWIAFRLIRPSTGEKANVRHGATLREAIWLIVLADVVMSLDNVIAISAAADGDVVLVIFGLLLSIPLVVWGSGILARLMSHHPWIIWLGGGLLGFVAGEMIFHDRIVAEWLGPTSPWLSRSISLTLAAIITVVGWRSYKGHAS